MAFEDSELERMEQRAEEEMDTLALEFYLLLLGVLAAAWRYFPPHHWVVSGCLCRGMMTEETEQHQTTRSDHLAHQAPAQLPPPSPEQGPNVRLSMGSGICHGAYSPAQPPITTGAVCGSPGTHRSGFMCGFSWIVCTQLGAAERIICSWLQVPVREQARARRALHALRAGGGSGALL